MKTIAGPGEWEAGEGLWSPRVVPDARSPVVTAAVGQGLVSLLLLASGPVIHPLRGTLRK